jgi:hypothetical protein
MQREAIKQLVAIAKTLVAGDEWVDDNTYLFVKALAKEMSRDPAIKITKVEFEHINFEFSIMLATIPLVMRVQEFGYLGEEEVTSESLNGDIYSEKNRSFRIPGGTTRKRDPKEFWQGARKMLLEIFEQAVRGA